MIVKRKYNERGGLFSAHWSERLRLFYMDEEVLSGFASYENYFQISKEEFDHFEDADFEPRSHMHTVIYLGGRGSYNTPEQEEMRRILMEEFYDGIRTSVKQQEADASENGNTN